MDKFLGPPSEKLVDKLKNILFAFGIYVLYMLLFSSFMEWLWTGQLFFSEPPFKYQFFMTCIYAGVVEEFVFRVAPIGLVKDKPQLLLPVVILSSALFGWLHNGAISLPVQGVFGFILACVYIKNSYSYWSVVLLHCMWNSYVMFIL